MSNLKNLLKNILYEVRGIREDLEIARKAENEWTREQAELNRKAVEEANERGRRMELKHAQRLMESQN